MRLGLHGTLFLICLVVVLPALAQDTEDCHACHEDSEMVGAYVNRGAYEASMHGWMDCVDCHTDIADVPHEDDLAAVDCSSCHESAAADHALSVHGRAEARGDELAPSCATCHTAHEVRSRLDPASPTAVLNVPALCGRCHHEGAPIDEISDIPQDQIIENYSMNIHGAALLRSGVTVTATCTSCHSSHEILEYSNPASSIHHDNVTATCAQCHGQIEGVHGGIIEKRLWTEAPDKLPACIDCHAPHRIRHAFYPAGLASQECLKCHADPTLEMRRDGQRVSLYVDATHFAASAHSGTACAQCHTEVRPASTRPCETVESSVDCSTCHAGVVEEFAGSTHGTLLAQGDPDAPACQDCHTKHAMQKKEWPTSPTFVRNVPELCANCHRAGEQAATRIDSDIPDIFAGYLDSIHGKGLVESGLLVTATCADCHTAHGELPPEDPRSTVHDRNVADTCGNCHFGIEETFKGSIHWPGNGETDRALPTCKDCHSSHSIGRTGENDARLSMLDQCGACHEREAGTYLHTFHGKVSRLGAAAVAMCHDCHGTHDILPPTEPASMLGQDNVVDTCRQCHDGAHAGFTGYLTHATYHERERYPWLFWTFWFMTSLLVGTLTVAALHTMLWLVRLWLSRDEWRAMRERTHATAQRYYRRFDYLQRNQHLVMMLSFFTLALTGMVLKFSYAGWAQWVAAAFGGFETTGVLHRIGAIVLFGVSAFHVWDVQKRRKQAGESWLQLIAGPNSILFQPKDGRELLQSIKWFIGLGPRPQYGRYTYWEKFDYFAVMWGVIIIGGTGLLLWFPETFTRLLPGWTINVATVIHSDEALLAVAFIFTIHFFNTHFRPDKFPMDMAIFTGRVPLDELRRDKPAEYDELMASPDRDKRIVEQFPRPLVRAFRVLGFVALAFGLSLILLIVYAMLFGSH